MEYREDQGRVEEDWNQLEEHDEDQSSVGSDTRKLYVHIHHNGDRHL